MEILNERAVVCPVASLHLTVNVVDLFMVAENDTLIGVAGVEAQANISLRRNPLAIMARRQGNMSGVEVTSTGQITGEVYEENSLNPLQEVKDKAFSEAIFKHLATNCLNCVFSDRCPNREPLGAAARNPSLRYRDA